MQKSQKAVFLLRDVEFLKHRVAKLINDSPSDTPFAIEVSRLALPQTFAKNCLEVQYYLTLWFAEGRRATKALGQLIERVKTAIPAAQYITNSDIGLLNARIRDVVEPIYGEHVIHGWSTSAPWAFRYLIGAVRPSLVAVTWHSHQAHEIGLSHRILGTAPHRPTRESVVGHVSGIVRYYGTAKFGEVRTPVELSEPMSGAASIVGLRSGKTKSAEDFAALLPLDSPDSSFYPPTRGAIPLVSRTGEGCFIPTIGGEKNINWMLASSSFANSYLIAEIKSAAERTKTQVIELTGNNHPVIISPFGNCTDEGTSPGKRAHLWRVVYSRILVLSTEEGDKLESALERTWQTSGRNASWQDVAQYANLAGLKHDGLKMLVKNAEVMLSQSERVLLDIAELLMGTRTQEMARTRVVILPHLNALEPGPGYNFLNELLELISYGQQANISFIIQLETPCPRLAKHLATHNRAFDYLALDPKQVARLPEVLSQIKEPQIMEGEVIICSRNEAGVYKFYRRPVAVNDQPKANDSEYANTIIAVTQTD